MHKSVPVVLAILVSAGLAGCLGGDSGGNPLAGTAVTADRLEVGSAYQFTHRGGTLALAMAGEGQAVLTLFDPDDVRMGQLEIGHDLFRQRIAIEDARPGDYVLHVDDLNGTLELRSRDAVVPSFEKLGRHFERIVLAGRPIQPGPLDPFVGPLINFGSNQPLDEELGFTLLRAPSHLRLLVVGQGHDLMVRVAGSSGTVYQSETFSYFTGSSFSAYRIEPLGGQFNARNVRDADYTARVSASHFEGYLILEAWSHSRLLPALPQAQYGTHAEVRFVYDQLPDRPVLVQVHDRAQALFAWAPALDVDDECDDVDPDNGASGNATTESCSDLSDRDPPEPAWVSLFDPDDRKLGTFPVLPGEVVRIPIERGGAYVAIAKLGTMWLGSDRAPADFQVRVLDVVQTAVPQTPSGSAHEYVVRDGNGTAQGVLFGIRPVIADSSRSNDLAGLLGDPSGPFRGCTDMGSIRIIQDGETIGYWGSGVPSALHRADLYLEPGEIQFVQDGMGGTCGHAALNLLSYIR